MPPARLQWSQCRSQAKSVKTEREEKSDTCTSRTVVSPYKVINSTLLAHIHFIVELPPKKTPQQPRVSSKKSLRGKIMLEQRAEWGSMDSIQLLVFHIGWDTFNASSVQNTTAHRGNTIITTLVRGEKKLNYIFFQRQNRMIAGFSLKQQ